MKLFDSHCHLDDKVYQVDFDRVRARMDDAGVVAVMIAGIDRAGSESAVALARAHRGFYASVGVHPHCAKTCDESALARLTALSLDPKVRAWGETGLDFNRMFSPKTDQERGFQRQLEAAHGRGLPVILHERDSDGRLLDILEDHRNNAPGFRGVVHCFSGTSPELTRYLDLGLYIGITGILTLKERGRRLRRQVPRIPLDRLLIETDAPYLTPAPEKNRFRRNEPAFVRSVLLKLAEVLDRDPESLAATLWDNTCRLFGVEGGR